MYCGSSGFREARAFHPLARSTTLRHLERDGLVSRRVHPGVPPRVDYELTRLGEALGEAVCGIWTWVEKHMKDVQRCRRAYDGKTNKPEVDE
jgi:DNA-binding HxlR family transcriptional regulator